VASLLGSVIPANSNTVRRSRQLPRSAPSIAARTRSISFSLQLALGALSLLWNWIVCGICPTAYAVGCILSPLRGWFCLYTFLGCIYLRGLWLGFCFWLGYGFCGLAGGGARAT